MTESDNVENSKHFTVLEEIISKHQRYIFNLAFRLCSNTEDDDGN